MRATTSIVLVAAICAATAGGVRAEPRAAACEDRAACVEIQLHVARGDDGDVVTPAWLEDQLAQANRHFAPIDVGFRVAGVDDRSVPHVSSKRDRSGLGVHLGRRVIDVFVTGRLDDVHTPAQQIRGVAWRVGGRKLVILSRIAGANVLAHELGHVFGLPHSAYPISIMNKTPRDLPPAAERTFAEEELAAIPRTLTRLLRARVIANHAARARRR